MSSLLQKRFLLPAMILFGLVIAVVVVKNKQPVNHQSTSKVAHPVNFVSIHKSTVKPQIKGFGEVSPDVLLQVLSEVSGKIVWVHPDLKKGSMLAAGTEVIRVNDLDYQLALKQAQANLAVSKANRKETQQTLNDARKSNQLARNKLTLAEKELSRLKKLKSKQSISQSTLDNQQSTVLQLQQEVQNLDTQLATLPANLEVLDAQIQIAQTNLELAQSNLAKTRLTIPFNARVEAVSIEEGQYVNTGSSLFSVQNVNKVMIEAQYSLAEFRILAKGFSGREDILTDAFSKDLDRSLMSRLGLQAKVQLAGVRGLPADNRWTAKVERIVGRLDAASRTLGVTVAVKDPYKNVIPGIKPPLLQGMYTQVTLSGNARDYYVIPRNALHENELYLIGKDDHLKRVPVKEYLLQGAYVLLEAGIEEGDRVITSDVFPAVNGMQVQPVEDSQNQTLLNDWLEAHR